MVYAQGSADLQETHRLLEKEVYPLSAGVESVKLDSGVWYPLQWYVRHRTRDGHMAVQCFEAAAKEDSHCITLEGSRDDDGNYNFGNPAGLLVKDSHIGDDEAVREAYRRQGPFKDLLWFPETYRRPGENRQDEAMHSQLVQDFRFFGDTATSRDSWVDALDYLLFRKLDRDWYTSKFYSYLP